MRFIASLIACMIVPHGVQAQSWDWQLSEPLNLQQPLDVIDLDPDMVTSAQMATLAPKVPMRICYVSVGTLEDWRADVPAFPAKVIGKTYGDWPDERLLDTRNLATLLPLMQARFAKCQQLGFTAIEPDNIDGHNNETGFNLTPDDTLRYVRALAGMAHGMGLQIGQKNSGALTPDLVGVLDFAITEGCLADGWCDQMHPYIAAGKPVFSVEYEAALADQPAQCAQAAAFGLRMIFKDPDLHAGGQRCK